MKINVIGGGTWGISLASTLSNKGHDIVLWQRDSNKTIELKKTLSYKNLPKLKIPSSISFTSNYNDLNADALFILAIPSHSISAFLKKNNNFNSQYLIACKGFDLKSSLLPSEVLNSQYNIILENIAILSGPNHAEEISLSKVCAAVIASQNPIFAKGLQKLFSSKSFRIYTSDDIYGVQVGAAIKNVIAIASGICVGLDLGDNAQAALVSRGMNEMLQLRRIYKINSDTLYGLTGLGDLIATSYSNHSRNKKLGLLIGRGMRLDNALHEIGMEVEGVNTAKILYNIILKNNLVMPICTEIYKILFNSYDPKNSINNLMLRELKNELS